MNAKRGGDLFAIFMCERISERGTGGDGGERERDRGELSIGYTVKAALDVFGLDRLPTTSDTSHLLPH
jgi:hypothetical protein